MKRILLAAGLAFVAGLLGWLFLTRGEPLRELRARQLASEALALIEAGELSRANAKANAAFQLAPRQAGVLRAAARFNEAVEHPQTAHFYRSLLETGKATPEERLRFVHWSLREGDLEQAAAALQQLEAEGLGGRERTRLSARLAAGRGDLSAAEEILRPLGDGPDAEPADRLELAEVLLQQGRPTATLEAVRGLRELSREEPGWELQARLLLMRAPTVAGALRIEEAEAVLALPAASLEARLEAAELLISNRPREREEILSGVLGKAADFTPAERRAVGAWLVRLGENERVLDLLPLNRALERKDWFLVWLDAASGLGRWQEVLGVLERPSVPLEPAYGALFRGRALRELGQEAEARQEFREALALAIRDPEALLYLAGYFLRIGEQELSERALETLMRNPATSRLALETALALQRQKGDLAAARELLELLSTRWPDDARLADELRYLRLLDGEQSADLLLAARDAFEKSPLIAHRMTYALALLELEQEAEALALFTGSDVPLGSLTPAQQLIFARVLDANALRDSAFEISRGIPRQDLLPEELRLLDEVRRVQAAPE